MTKTKPKKLLSLLFSSLVIIGVVALIFKLTSKPAQAAWYDDSWQYRTKIVITNTGSAVTNQKVKFDIATDSLITAVKIQSDCGDSRFVSSTGEILRYYLDTAGGACNTASTDYYVLIPSINVGSVVLYHYYGNPGAANGTEGANFAQTTFTPNSSSTSTEEKGSSPIGYWKFDEGVDNTCVGGTNDVCNSGSAGTTLDGIAANFAVPATSTSGWTTGKFSKGLIFDGSNDVVVITDTAVIRPGNESWTASVWANPANSNQQSPLLAKRQNSGNFEQWSLNICGDIGCGSTGQNLVALFRESDAIERRAISTADVVDGNWHHYAMVADKNADKIRLYVDGIEKATTLITDGVWPTVDNTDNFRMGNDNGSLYYNKALDEIKIYNYALSSNDIRIDYNRGSALVFGTTNTNQNSTGGSGNEPYAYLNFNEKTGSTAYDTSGNALSGSIVKAQWAPGKYGSGLKFDGGAGTSYVRVPTTWRLAAPVTIQMWSKPGTGTTVVYCTDNTGVLCAQYNGATDNKYYFSIDTSNVAYSLNASSFAVNPNEWHLTTHIYDGTNMTAYVDGRLAVTVAATGTLTYGVADDYSIGAYCSNTPCGSGTSFDGTIDEVKLFNYARSPAQIMFDYNKGAPIGYWKFDEGTDNTCAGGTNDVCNSGNTGSSIDGAVSGTAVPATSTSGWTSSGKFGKAMNFDGTNDYVSFGTQSSLDVIGGDFTVSSWVKTAQTGSTKWILQKGSGNLLASDKGYSLYLGTSGTKWTFGVWDGTSGHDITPSTTQGVDTTNWHHIVGVFVASTKTAYLYVDGVLASQATNSSYSTPSISANNFNIGATGAAGSNWSGGIDEVKVYSYALSSDEVKLDYNQRASLVLGTEDTGAKITGGAGSAPLAYWDLNEKTGLTAIDKSGTGINGTLEGGAKWTSGKFGSALYFDGVDDRVNMGDVTTFDSQTGLSVSLWTKISTLATARRLVSKWTASQSTFMISLDDTNSDELIMAVSDGTHYDVFSTTNADLVTNRWYHIEMTWTDTTRAIYVNGVSMALTTTLNQAITGTNNSTEPLQIGDSGETTPFNGFIDEVKIYNYARSQGLVAYDYNHGAPAGLWPLDDCQGTTAVDASPNSNGDFNGHNGTITIGGTGTYTSAGSCNSGTSTEAWNGGTTGKINSALGFDGTNDYVEIAYASTLAPSVSISFGGWFYTTDKTQTSQSILSKTQGGGYNLFLNNTGGACGSTTSLCGLVNVSSSYYAVDYPVSNLSNNTWYHAMVTFNGSIVKLYLNGQLVDSKPASGVVTYTVTNALCIGAEPGNTVCDAGSPFNGKLDDIRVYNYDLSPTQIKEVYNQGSLYFGPSTGTP